MAEFMCGCRGNRGEATRLGSEESGCEAWVKSWQTEVRILMDKVDNSDRVNLMLYDLDTKTIKPKRVNIRMPYTDKEVFINGISLKELFEAKEIIDFPSKVSGKEVVN